MYYIAQIRNEGNTVVDSCTALGHAPHTTANAAHKCESALHAKHNSDENMTARVLMASHPHVLKNYNPVDYYYETISRPSEGSTCPRCERADRSGTYIVSPSLGQGVIECDSCPNPRDSRLDYGWKDERKMRTKTSTSRPSKVKEEVVVGYRNPNDRGERHTPKGHAHPCFSDLVNRISAGLPTMLVGEAGTGKTFIVEQVANYLGRPFGTISCTGGMTESQFTGRLVPIGEGGTFEFMETTLIKMVREGGIFLADEFDAADPNVALVLNQLSANRRLVLPNNPVEPCIEAHPDFVIVFSANTFGTGADRMYVGRNQLDAATLDRVKMGTLVVGYDATLERKLIPNTELRKAFQDVRKKAQATRLRRVISMRAMLNAATLVEKCGWSTEECVDQLTQDWTADEKAKVGVQNR
tara:strand:- start:964 stop:2199 length:1236 start_codon:yes stop_codon:yes gene_type:complete